MCELKRILQQHNVIELLSDQESERLPVCASLRRLFSDLATYLSEATGKRVKYEQQTYEQFAQDLRKAGFPENAVSLSAQL